MKLAQFFLLIVSLALAACSPNVTGERPTVISTALPPPPAGTLPPARTASATATTAPTATTPGAGPPLQIRQLQMLGATTGWATGLAEGDTRARILFTADGGQSWQDRTPPADPAPGDPATRPISAALYFASAQRGWVTYERPAPQAGSAPLVWSTADGGQSWQSSTPLDLSDLPFDFYYPSDLGFAGEQSGWLLAHLGVGMSHDYIGLFRTTDGGQSWQRVADPDSQPAIQACPKSALLFTSAQEGWLAGDCPGLMPALFLYHSVDGGATWSQATIPPPEGLVADSLGDRCGVLQLAAGAPGRLLLLLRCVNFEESSARSWLYSATGAANWQAQPLPVAATAFAFISPEQGWVLEAETEAGAGQQLLQTTDAGATWNRLATVQAPGQSEMTFADPRHGWITAGYEGERHLLHTNDGGQSWQEMTPHLSADPS